MTCRTSNRQKPRNCLLSLSSRRARHGGLVANATAALTQALVQDNAPQMTHWAPTLSGFTELAMQLVVRCRLPESPPAHVHLQGDNAAFANANYAVRVCISYRYHSANLCFLWATRGLQLVLYKYTNAFSHSFYF